MDGPERFKSLLKDPRFIRPQKKHTKVNIDDRFKDKLKDPHFGSSFSPCVTDKSGRPFLAKKGSQSSAFSQYYNLEDREENIEKSIPIDPIDEEEAFFSNDEDSTTMDNDILYNTNPSSVDQENITTGSATSRLAFINLDWDNIHAEDIFFLANSFKPPLGQIKSVKIYYSAFGMERISYESKYGPPNSIFKEPSRLNSGEFQGNSYEDGIEPLDASETESELGPETDDELKSEQEASIELDTGSSESDSSCFYSQDSLPDEEVFTDCNSSNSTSHCTRHDVLQSDQKVAQTSHNVPSSQDRFVTATTAEDFDEDALRKYQLERLRYCFAVVETDSVETASCIYSNCDGLEFEKTCNIIDIRYIPCDEVFDDGNLVPGDKGICSSLPDRYDPIKFATLSLMHSKVTLSWDADDPRRTRLTKARFSQEALDEMDFRAYLATSEDEKEDNGLSAGERETQDEAQLVSMYKKLAKKPLLQLQNEKRPKDIFDDNGDDDDDDVDMEMKFPLSSKPSDLSEETVFQAMLRKEKEKKRARREKGRHALSMMKEDKSLSLLVNESDDENKHFNMEEIVRNERRKHGPIDTFEIEPEDPRFSALYSSHDYAIDPSHPSFKSTTSMKKLFAAKRAKRLQT